jgi:5-methylthioadenosine/S-adenosylhomocysteine deaminase
MKVLIRNVNILTMDDAMTRYASGFVLTDGEKIAEAGNGEYQGSLSGVQTIDGHQGILLPGFVNTHTHVSMIPFRSMGDDCRDRLNRFLFPLELKAMTPELVYQAARYGICELLLGGVTTFADMYYFEDRVAEAAKELGIRVYAGETVIGQPTCDAAEPYGGLEIAERFMKEWKDVPHIHPFAAPHATNTCSGEKLRETFELDRKADALFSLHNAEMDYEMKYFRDTFDCSPTEYLDQCGVLDRRTLLAHCIHLSEHDISLLREKRTAVAHCIGANTKAGKGVAPLKELTDAGVRAGFGSDGPSSGNTLDLFVQMRLAASFHKTYNHDRALFPTEKLVRMATRGGAEALSASHYGSIEKGRAADLVLMETESVNMFPCYDPYAVLVYSANAGNVSLVMAAGKIVVKDKKLTVADLSEERRKLNDLMGPFSRAAAEYRDIL